MCLKNGAILRDNGALFMFVYVILDTCSAWVVSYVHFDIVTFMIDNVRFWQHPHSC